MGNLIGTHAVVIGAGIGGLSAAKALSDYFGKVTILERDLLPARPAPRVGAPQSRQVHVLLGGGVLALERILPGIADALVAGGAHRARVGSEIRVELPGMPVLPTRPFDFHSMCMTRPLCEFVIRNEVLKAPNISIRNQCRASAIAASEDGSRVIGVQFQEKGGISGLLEADFVVDAASRSDLTLSLLDRLNIPRPRDTEIGIHLTYATAIFEIPPSSIGDWKAVIHRPDSASGRGGFLFPIEGGQWHVNLNGVHGDGAGTSESEFLEFAKSLRTSTIYDALKTGTMIGPVNKFILEASSRRRYEELEQFPERLVVIGDAICRYNPAYGQGMSVAAQEASALHDVLGARVASRRSIDDFAHEYFPRMAEILGAPWTVAESDFVYPQTRGERSPEVFERINANRNLQRLAYNDPALHLLWAEVTNLLKPASVLQEPRIAALLQEPQPEFSADPLTSVRQYAT